jgi:hypothetical protein
VSLSCSSGIVIVSDDSHAEVLDIMALPRMLCDVVQTLAELLSVSDCTILFGYSVEKVTGGIEILLNGIQR